MYTLLRANTTKNRQPPHWVKPPRRVDTSLKEPYLTKALPCPWASLMPSPVKSPWAAFGAAAAQPDSTFIPDYLLQRLHIAEIGFFLAFTDREGCRDFAVHKPNSLKWAATSVSGFPRSPSTQSTTLPPGPSIGIKRILNPAIKASTKRTSAPNLKS